MSRVYRWVYTYVLVVAARLGIHPAVLLVSAAGAVVGAIAGLLTALVSSELLGDDSLRPVYVESRFADVGADVGADDDDADVGADDDDDDDDDADVGADDDDADVGADDDDDADVGADDDAEGSNSRR